MNYGKTIILLITIVWLHLTDCCIVKCSKLNDYLCAGEHLITPAFISRVESLAHLLFSICHYDPDDGKYYKVVHDDSNLKNSNFRPSLGITLTECNTTINMEEAIESNSLIWNNPDCRVDNFLLLLVHNNTVYPHLSVRRSPAHDFQLERSYNLTSLDEITEIALLKMEELNRVHQTHANEEFTENSQDIKSHWPTWALVVVAVCIILSLLAFFLGNYITKRATPIRNKSQTQSAGKRERKWGAGFAGGLWANA